MPGYVDRVAIKQAMVTAIQADMDTEFGTGADKVRVFYDWPGDEAGDRYVYLGPPLGTQEPTTFGGNSPTRRDEFTITAVVGVNAAKDSQTGDADVQAILDTLIASLFTGPSRPGQSEGANPYPDGQLDGPLTYMPQSGEALVSQAFLTFAVSAHTTAS